MGGESRPRGLQCLGAWCCCHTIFSWVSHPFLKSPSVFLLANSVPSVAVIILHLLQLVYLLKTKYCRKSQLPYPKNCLKVQLEEREGRKGTAVQRGGILVFISHSKAAGEVPGQTLIEKGKKSTTYYLIPGQETAF